MYRLVSGTVSGGDPLLLPREPPLRDYHSVTMRERDIVPHTEQRIYDRAVRHRSGVLEDPNAPVSSRYTFAGAASGYR